MKRWILIGHQYVQRERATVKTLISRLQYVTLWPRPPHTVHGLLRTTATTGSAQCRALQCYRGDVGACGFYFKICQINN